MKQFATPTKLSPANLANPAGNRWHRCLTIGERTLTVSAKRNIFWERLAAVWFLFFFVIFYFAYYIDFHYNLLSDENIVEMLAFFLYFKTTRSLKLTHWCNFFQLLFFNKTTCVSEVITSNLASFNSILANSSPKISATMRSAKKRIEGLSQKEQDELKEFAWFQAGIPREISLELLLRKNPGDFLVRESTTKPGCFALSLRVPPPGPKVAHYLIVKTSRGYKIKVN